MARKEMNSKDVPRLGLLTQQKLHRSFDLFCRHRLEVQGTSLPFSDSMIMSSSFGRWFTTPRARGAV